MKKQIFQLNSMGLSAMTEQEMIDVDGGGFWKWVGAVVGAVVGFVVGGIPGAIVGAMYGFALGAVVDIMAGDPGLIIPNPDGSGFSVILG